MRRAGALAILLAAIALGLAARAEAGEPELPAPGTVIFAGYSSMSSEPEPLRFHDLRRTNDGFFVKVSYLFRM